MAKICPNKKEFGHLAKFTNSLEQLKDLVRIQQYPTELEHLVTIKQCP